MRTLICDLNVYDEGHHIAYVNAILAFSSDREDVLFLFNKAAAHYCPYLEGDKRVSFVGEEFLTETNKHVFSGKWQQYRYIRQFAIEHAVDKVVLLEIDQFQAAVGLTPAPYRVGGILFRSFHKIGIQSGSLPESLKNALYSIKKRLLFQVLRLNRKIDPLFLLNDRSGCERYPRYFKYLPDPIFKTTTAQAAGVGKAASVPLKNIRESLGIPAASHVFLAFGAMGTRKNVPNIVDAFLEARLDAPSSVLLLAGKVRNDYREVWDGTIKSFHERNKDPRKRLIAVDKFIDDDQVDAWFKASDTIVICYSKFYGSSGLMGIAAQHEKTCLVPDQGLLYELCREYSLGYAANPLDTGSIARALSLSENMPAGGPGHRRFVQEHSEDAFLKTLLQ